MVYERPPSADTTMIEATPAGTTPDEAIPARAMPEADTHMEEGPDDVAPVEEAAPVEEDNRDQQASNAVEREIGGNVSYVTTSAWTPRSVLCAKGGGSLTMRGSWW